MWKTVKQSWATCVRWCRRVWWARGEWWAVYMAGPKVHLDTMLETACRRVLAAHEARFGQFADHSQVQIRLMDENERNIVTERTIANYLRRPQITFGGRSYNAVRQVDQVWIYRANKS